MIVNVTIEPDSGVASDQLMSVSSRSTLGPTRTRFQVSNGVASVLASVLGVAIAVNFGFPAASFVALACYGFALLHVVRGEWA